MPDLGPFPSALRDAILAWYGSRGRSLPFRGTTDPYAILVSEAMAQQTQVARAGETWIRFMERFPTAAALAAATPADVLRAWQGLGYNRRALNLWRAARRIVEVHGGRVPADLAALQALPGVGPYTARAVAALAFGMPVGAVDTNVRRVLGRIVAGDSAALGATALQKVADAAVPLDRPGAWTHALMDVGATSCRPGRPDCASCPAQAWCRFAAAELAGGNRARPVPGARSVTGPAATAAREAPPAFATTSRWLRGRIVDQLRAAQDGAWIVLDAPIGEHDRAAVAAALEALARDGLVELDGADPTAARRARLPIR
ncbi:MAG: A/G-specific adenine glycosylase [Candidatus Limnocylindrales bacterium]|nr:A/G-specific adenine glycosylase [Candidatus Limnocylindrales bacterium]